MCPLLWCAGIYILRHFNYLYLAAWLYSTSAKRFSADCPDLTAGRGSYYGKNVEFCRTIFVRIADEKPE